MAQKLQACHQLVLIVCSLLLEIRLRLRDLLPPLHDGVLVIAQHRVGPSARRHRRGQGAARSSQPHRPGGSSRREGEHLLPAKSREGGESSERAPLEIER
eukprot:scaffold31785_cov72-Phaeocystis_antarctica.AAC.11